MRWWFVSACLFLGLAGCETDQGVASTWKSPEYPTLDTVSAECEALLSNYLPHCSLAGMQPVFEWDSTYLEDKAAEIDELYRRWITMLASREVKPHLMLEAFRSLHELRHGEESYMTYAYRLKYVAEDGSEANHGPYKGYVSYVGDSLTFISVIDTPYREVFRTTTPGAWDKLIPGDLEDPRGMLSYDRTGVVKIDKCKHYWGITYAGEVKYRSQGVLFEADSMVWFPLHLEMEGFGPARISNDSLTLTGSGFVLGEDWWEIGRVQATVKLDEEKGENGIN